MQALLLLCAWPFPFAHTADDPSPVYCSHATQIGLQLGLHRPHFKMDFVDSVAFTTPTSQEERRAWYGCFIMNQSYDYGHSSIDFADQFHDRLALRLGLPPTLSSGYATSSAATEESVATGVPKMLIMQLKMSVLSYQALKTLGDDETTCSGQHPSPHALIDAFESRCRQIRELFPQPWPSTAEIAYLTLRLQLYAFVLASDREMRQTDRTRTPRTGPETDYLREYGNLYRVEAASIIVRLIEEVSRSGVEARSRWPFFPQYSTLYAASIGIFIECLDDHDSASQRKLLDMCRTVVPILSSWSFASGDQMDRLSGHLAFALNTMQADQVTRVAFGHELSDKPLFVNARAAANIPYQIVWSAKFASSYSSGLSSASFWCLDPGADS